MYANKEQGRGTSPSLGHGLFLCSGPHKVCRTNIHCAWEHDSWCPCLELLITVHMSSRCLWAPSNCPRNPAWRSYKLAFSALVAEKVIKDPPSMTISRWNRGYWKLLPLLFFLFTASLCTEDFASITIPHLDNEINESWAPESSLLGIFVMNCNTYYAYCDLQLPFLCEPGSKRCVTWPTLWQ